MINKHKMKRAILHQLAFIAMVTVISSSTAQTLLDENFSSGFEEWTVVHPPGAFNGSTRWQVDVAGETLFENSNVRAPDSAGMLINDAKTGPFLVSNPGETRLWPGFLSPGQAMRKGLPRLAKRLVSLCINRLK